LAAVPDEDNSLQLEDGRKLHHVRIVGAVREVNDSSTSVIYTVEDGTGLIEVKRWLDESECTALSEIRQQTFKDNIYVKIVGSIKEYDGKKMIVADSIRPLSTGNELTHHMLEVVYSAEHFKRKDTIVAPPPMMAGGVGFGGSAVKTGAPIQASGTGDNLKDAVVNYIRQVGDQMEVGANVQECVQTLTAGGRHSESAVRQVIDDLASEGHIYSTINEENYKFAM